MKKAFLLLSFLVAAFLSKAQSTPPLYAEQSSLVNTSVWSLKSGTVRSAWWDGNTVVSKNDTLFSLGGWQSGPILIDSIFYSVDDGVNWAGYVGKLPFAMHTFAFITSPDGWFYICGGDHFSTSTQKKSVYRTRDLINWTLMTNNYGGEIRILAGAWADDSGNIYWGGGQKGINAEGLNDIWKSVNGGSTWTLAASSIAVGGDSILGKNISNNLVYFDGRVYVVGGGVYDAGPPANFTYTKKVYSASLNDLTKWKAENDLPFLVGRQYNSVAIWDGKIWNIGGYNGSANTDSIGFMNKGGTWQLFKTGTLPVASHGAGIGVHRDKLFYVLGNYNNNCYMLKRDSSLFVEKDVNINGVFKSEDYAYSEPRFVYSKTDGTLKAASQIPLSSPLQVGLGTMIFPPTTGYNTFSSASAAKNAFNATNTASNGYMQVLLAETTSNHAYITRWNSAYSGNYTGTSQPFANSLQIASGTSLNQPLVLTASPIIGATGTISTYAALRLSTDGFYLGTNATIHSGGAFDGSNFYFNPTSKTATSKNFFVPAKTGLYMIGIYGTVSETGGGAAYISGNSIKADPSVDNKVIKTSVDQGQFMRMRYDQGISFHTNLLGSIGTSFADDANLRWKIDNSGNLLTGTDGVGTIGASGANRPSDIYASGLISAPKHIVATSVFGSSGTGSPEGVLTANVGSLYSRTDGGTGTTLYVKESGTGNTGWVAK